MDMATVHVLAEDPALRRALTRRVGAAAVAATVVVSHGATVEEALLRCRRWAGARLVLVADEISATSVYRAVRAGVSAILRRADTDRLAMTVQAAAATEGGMPGADVGRLLEDMHPAPAGDRLTDREVHVLRLVADGYGNADIARHLECSQHTVKNTIHDLMTRLRLRNRTHAAAFAVRSGLV